MSALKNLFTLLVICTRCRVPPVHEVRFAGIPVQALIKNKPEELISKMFYLVKKRNRERKKHLRTLRDHSWLCCDKQRNQSFSREESEDPRNYISGFEYGGVSCSARHKPRKPNIRLPYPILNKNNIVLYKAAFKILVITRRKQNRKCPDIWLSFFSPSVDKTPGKSSRYFAQWRKDDKTSHRVFDKLITL